MIDLTGFIVPIHADQKPVLLKIVGEVRMNTRFIATFSSVEAMHAFENLAEYGHAIIEDSNAFLRTTWALKPPIDVILIDPSNQNEGVRYVNQISRPQTFH